MEQNIRLVQKAINDTLLSEQEAKLGAHKNPNCHALFPRPVKSNKKRKKLNSSLYKPLRFLQEICYYILNSQSLLSLFSE